MQNDSHHTSQTQTATVESIDQEGRGVAHVEGKAVFIEGALVGEKVTYQSTTRKLTYEFGRVLDVLKASSQRVTPQCPHFSRCGGCSLQHLDVTAQVAAKQRLLEDNLWHISRIRPERMLPALLGPAWAYRHKARLRVKYVPAKQRVLVGFNEKHTHFVVDMNSCEVLPKRLSALIIPLQEMIYQLTIRDAIPQIEVAVGEGDVIVLVIRMLEPPEAKDEDILLAFADKHGVQVWEQRKGLNTVKPLEGSNGNALGYALPEFDLHFPFSPVEFTQVNPHINRVMIRRAMQLLEPKAGERIADFFCGLGNFSLPIARSGASVMGYEGAEALVARAQQNARLNRLEANVSFKVLDLFLVSAHDLNGLGQFDKWLIDPPRDGAMELIKSLANIEDAGRVNVNPKRIVYVSCNPATLARDAGLLVLYKGYRLAACGVINMFPHTTHVESIALFEWQ